MAPANKQSWHKLGAVSPGRLEPARLQAHYASQWIARVGYTYVDEKPDFSHTSMTWSETDQAMVGAWVESGRSPFRLCASFDTLSLAVKTRDTQAVRSIALAGKGDDDVRTWLASALNDFGLDGSQLPADVPYEMPSSPLASGDAYNLEEHHQGLRELQSYFSNISVLLDEIAESNAGAAPVRCWPHHFDLATLISLEEGDPETARSIGIGFSPGDDNYAEPYLYISPWPYPVVETLPGALDPAFWHVEEFVSLVLKASDFAMLEDEPKQQETASSYLISGLEMNRAVLA